jgi:hypothetical protein
MKKSISQTYAAALNVGLAALYGKLLPGRT